MHFHAHPSLFHRSSPPYFSRRGLRLVLRGGGCNRSSLLLSRFLSLFLASPPLSRHRSSSASYSLFRPRRSFSYSSFVLHRVPSRLVRRPPFRISLSLRLIVRSPTAAALDRSASRSSTLCAALSKVSARARPLCHAPTGRQRAHVTHSFRCRSSTLCAALSKPITPRSPYTPTVRTLREIVLSYSGFEW